MTERALDIIAPISRRAIAYVIDALISSAIAVIGIVVLTVVAFNTRPIENLLIVMPIGYGVLMLVLLAWLIVYTMMQSGNGTIGMRAQGVRLASVDDGMPVGFGRALLRNLVFGVASWIVVGYFTPLFDSSGRFQGWHDKAAKTVVIDARKSPRPGAASRAAAAAPATTAIPVVPPMPVTPPVPGAPAVPSAHGGFTAPSAPGASTPAAPAVPAAPGVPPVPIVAPAPFPSPVLDQPQSTGFAYPAPPAPRFPAAASGYETPAGSFDAPAPYEAPAYDAAAAAVSAAQFEQPAAPASDGALIAFVPGVTQPGPIERNPEPEAGGLDPSLDETVIEPRQPQAPAPVVPDALIQAPAAPIEPLVQEQTIRDPETAVAASAPFSESSPTIDAPDSYEAELEATRISVPGHGLVFTWDDGVRTTVTRRTVFGRNPAPEDGVVRSAVRDETLSLSKTHFEAAAEVSGGWVMDRHSTNGMTIVRNGQRIACPAGQRVPVQLGDAIEIGDRIVVIGGYV